jgi:hypothetical protein
MAVMAKKDAVFNYSSAFDTSGYLSGIKSVWTANKDKAFNAGIHKFWSGTPTEDKTPPAGWERENAKYLSAWECDLDSSVSGSNDQGFQTELHRLIYDIKRALNLPNQEDLASWKDEYTCADGEHHLFFWTKAGTADCPYTCRTSHNVLPEGAPIKANLIIGIEGFDVHGGTDDSPSVDVRPSMSTQSVFDNHYKTQYDASTLAADYTSPTLVGSEYTLRSNLMLLNYENAWKGSDVVRSKDNLSINIAWSSHTYAQIKTIIDTAIA